MGRDAHCTAVYNRRRLTGKAQIETDVVTFRGEDVRATLPFNALTAVTTRGGRLTLTTAVETLVLDLGDAAERWAEKIRNPPTVLDKLGVTQGMSVAVVGRFEKAFESEPLTGVAPQGRTKVPPHVRLLTSAAVRRQTQADG